MACASGYSSITYYEKPWVSECGSRFLYEKEVALIWLHAICLNGILHSKDLYRRREMKMEQFTLQAELRLIRDRGYAVPNDTDAYPYAQIIMEEIGSADADFRELVYEVLKHWIANGVFRHKELRGLLLQAISSDYVLHGIGENGTDSVFHRAASASITAAIVSSHERDPFLSETQLESVAEQMIEYLYLEQDVRGYIEGKGKAQTVACGADALTVIARCLAKEQDSLAYAMLEAIKEKVCNRERVYAHFEDEHFVRVVLVLWEKGLINEMYMAAWIVNFLEIEEALQPARDIVTQNIKMFLRSFYFRVADDAVASVLFEALQQLRLRENE